MSAERLQWYWHRLKAMDGVEVRSHFRKKLHQLADGFLGAPRGKAGPPAPGAFPQLPAPESCPAALREALAEEWPRLAAGRWQAFGHIGLSVEVPPNWQKDYLAGIDLRSSTTAFRLNHRKLPGRSDIKLVWELSRWSPLVRLAQASRILRDPRPAELVVRCLEDWITTNPAYRGWNWTSALESGLRLIQFSWIESLLGPERLTTVVDRLLPAHVHYTWRHRSFGSSANNHLLGELAGVILAVVRRPELARFSTSLEELQRLWESEVLKQFHSDGGNVEQALNYHLFSFEFCWQVRMALVQAGRQVDAEVEERLRRAVDFFVAVQVDSELWDYGDSDSAWVTPLFSNETKATAEWLGWANGTPLGESVRYWMGDPPPPHPQPNCASIPAGGLHFQETGLACWADGEWNLRWDLSPLGYLATAAHGHLDALHLSIWFGGRALVVDPGTGAYYGDRELRKHLASWAAHNGPVPVGLSFPSRRGPFLWAEKHEQPRLDWMYGPSVRGKLKLPQGEVERTVTRLEGENGWSVDDDFVPADSRADSPFEVRWQFAPGWSVTPVHDRMFLFSREGVSVQVGLDSAWKSVELLNPSDGGPGNCFHEGDFTGVCSSRFREVRRGPLLRLVARGHNPCLFRTTFLASRGA